MNTITDAINNLAEAIRELAAASRPPDPEPEPEWRCLHCGSPKWRPGGMAEEFKVCMDCGTIGEFINAPGDS